MKKTAVLIVSILMIAANIFAQETVEPAKRNIYIHRTPYFKTIFNQDEQEKFLAALDIYPKADKSFEKYKRYQEKADFYYKSSRVPLSKSKTERYKRRAQKYQAKANFHGMKALDEYSTANLDISTLLTNKIIAYKDTANKNLQDTLRKLIAEAQSKVSYYKGAAINKSNKAKIENLIKAYNYELQVIYYKQNLLSVLAKDLETTKKLYAQYNVSKNNKQTNNKKQNNTNNNNSNKQNNTNTNTNNNNVTNNKQVKKDSAQKYQIKAIAYNLRYNELANYLSYDNVEMSKFNMARNQISIARSYYAPSYKLIRAADSLDYEAQYQYDLTLAAQTAKEAENLRKQAIKMRQDADSMYIKAYSTLYSLYNARLIMYQASKPAIKPFINRAQKLHSISDKFLQLSKKDKANAYIYQSEALNYLILALIEQENALATFFGTVVNNVNYFVPQKIDLTQQNQTNNKNNKTNTSKKTTTKQTAKKPAKPAKKKVVSTQNLKPSGIWTYDLNNTKPRYLKETGTYYRVYVYTTSQKLNPKEFRKWQPITYISYHNSKLKKYYVGKYASYKEAQKAQYELRKLGFKAQIVKFVNGKPAGSKVITSKPAASGSSTPFVNATDISKTKYLVYVIQLGTFSTPKTKAQLKNLSKIYKTDLADGRIIYYVGPYYKYSVAKAQLPHIQQLGFSDAFVTAFNNGKRISIDKAIAIEKSVQKSNQVIFRVQVGAFSDYLTDKEIKKYFGKLSGLTLHSNRKGDKIIYSVGDAKSYEQAKKLRDKVRSLGYSDAFIIAFKGEKIVSLSQVVNK